MQLNLISPRLTMRVLDMLKDRPKGSKTLMNIGFLECHYPLDLRSKSGFRLYCASPLDHPKHNYCEEHRAVMFYRKPKEGEDGNPTGQ
jgi:hypothetical protein